MEEDSAKVPVEMVTVPALGAEWGKDELNAMTKKGRKEQQSEGFGRKWRAFNRGQYGLFGSKWLTRRTIVFVVFALCAMYVFSPSLFWCTRADLVYILHPISLFRSIGITLAIVIPRVPDFAVNGSNPLTSATGWFNQSITAQFSRAPANFTLDAQVYDLNSFRLVGTGHLNRTKVPAKKFTDIQMPLNFTYLATNDSDLTCQSASF